MKRSIAILLIIILIGAGAYCANRYYREDVLPEKQINEIHDEQIELFKMIKPESSVSADKEEPLQSAEEVNSSVVGWITIDGTHIDYPVAQAEDNDFYLHNGFDGEYNNELGCPFLDYRCAPDFSGFNSIVYAHNMTEQRMFADIALFKDEAFLQTHPTGTLILKDGPHNVRFFAYMSVSSTAPAYHAVFAGNKEKEEYIDYIFSDSKYTELYTPDELKQDDDLHILLLSTCTFETEDTRGVLAGVIE